MKKLLFAIIAITALSLSLAGCGSKSDSAKPAPAAKQESVADLLGKSKNLSGGLTYDYVFTSKDLQMNGKFWLMGKKVKSEITVANQKVISIIDGDANTMYNYMPEQKMAAKMTFDPTKVQATPDKYNQGFDPAKAKVIETVTYDGVKCKVIEIEEPKGVKQKMWLREDYGMPAKVEITDDKGAKQTIEFKNMKTENLSPSVFQLPADVKVTDITSMMKNLPAKS